MSGAAGEHAQSPALEAWRMFRRNIPAMAGLVVLLGIV